MSQGGIPMDYDAIIIGTGFGGTIAATRLAMKGKKVLMLERGTWWVTPETLGKQPPGKTVREWAKENNHPVQYWPRPDHRKGLLDLFATIRHSGNRDGLYQYSIFEQAHIVTASGVGGGSLIYSNVTLRPNQEVLQSIGLNLGDPEYQAAYDWMNNYRGKLNKIVTKIPLPGRDVSNLGADDYLYLDRSRVLKEAAGVVSPNLGINAPWGPLDLSVIEYDPATDSDAAKAHTFCERQGRCLLGCLPAARHTLNKTLYKRLLLDPNSGVTLWPLAEARYIKSVDGGYQVNFRDDRDHAQEKSVKAQMVFLAGGTLGTTEILLRSREHSDEPGGLKFSEKLGSQFSTNGDFAGFVLGTKNPVYSARGPINTCHVQVKFDGFHITIEDCAIPNMFAAVVSTGLQVLDNFFKREAFRAEMILSWTNKALPDLKNFFPSFPDTYDPTSYKTEAEMVSNIFFFNVMAQDDASGVFQLDNDRINLNWPNKPVAEHLVFQKIDTLLKAFADAMGGRYIPFPLWSGLANRKLIITHPLGGCPIGTNNSNGVVNELGQVIDGSKPHESTDTFPNLYIVDGSVIPGALAANPSLTISAQALKAVAAALP
jgi:cholesterol oxidase